MAKDKLFYVGQKAFIENDKGEVLVTFVNDHELDIPGGKIQEGEADFKQALHREIAEETGLTIQIGDPFTIWTNHWRSEMFKPQQIFIIGYKCTYISGTVKLSDENSGFKWVNKNNYKTVDDGTDYFKALEKYFLLRESVSF